MNQWQNRIEWYQQQQQQNNVWAGVLLYVSLKDRNIYDLVCLMWPTACFYVSGYRKFIFTNSSYFVNVCVCVWVWGVFFICSFSSLFVSKSLTITMNQSILVSSSSEINRRDEACFFTYSSPSPFFWSSSFESDWHSIAIFQNENFSFSLKLILFLFLLLFVFHRLYQSFA